MKQKYKIETLTPVHIGTGDELDMLGCVLNSSRLFVVNMNKLFEKISEDQKEKFSKFISDKTSKITLFEEKKRNTRNKNQKRQLQNKINDIKKEISLGNILKSILNATLIFNEIISEKSDLVYYVVNSEDIGINSIHLQIKNVFNQPYLPGTSIKGAIRTAILWYILKNNSNKLQDAVNKIENGLQKMENEIRQKPKDKRRIIEKWKTKIDNEMDAFIFGRDPNYDFLRALQLEDSDPFSITSLEVSDVKILTTTQNGAQPKRFPNFTETLMNAKSNLKIKIDDFLLEEDIAKKLNFDGKQKFLEIISKICNSYAKEFINSEIDFFDRYNLPVLANAYEDLLDEIPSNNNAFLLHLGWGSGWHGMTIGRIIQDVSGCYDNKRCFGGGVCRFHNTIFCKLRKDFDLGKKKTNNQYIFIKEFPKTRKIVFKNNHPKYPLGWIKLTRCD